MKRIILSLAVILIAAFIVSCGSGGRGPVGKWDFSDPAGGTQGWDLASPEFYMYKGPIKLSHDSETLGIGLLRLDVDFTDAVELEWSEPKLFIDLPRALPMKGKQNFVFDFYYNPSLHPDGAHFKTKVFTNNNGIMINNTSDEILGGEDVGNGFVKQKVSILIMPVNGFMTDMRFSVAGYLTNYKGPVFFNNMRWE